jgi:Uma2 family endonuclease
VTQGKFELSIGGDVIVEADGKKTGTIQEFEKWSESNPTKSNLKIYRNGSIIEVTLHK